MAEDMQLMQQEAARRVRRMQEHSRRVFEEHGGRTAESLRAAQPPHYAPPPLYRRPEVPAPQQEPCPPPHLQEKQPAGGLLGGFDTEQLLLLGLALLLFRNGCRVELIVALVYLAM